MLRFQGGKKVTAKAPEVLQWLVKFAEAGREVTYRELGDCVGLFWRTVPQVLGVIGHALQELKPKFGMVPQIQLLVVSAGTRVPGDSGLAWTGLSKEELAKWTKDRKKILTKGLQKGIFEWRRWREVLAEFDLLPLQLGVVPPQAALKSYETAYNQRGEGEDHRRLKDYVARHGVRLGLIRASLHPSKEYVTLSGDRLDVFFESPNEWVCVEVKGRGSNGDDVRRGVFQCVKYRAVLEAQRHYSAGIGVLPSVRVVLVLANEFPGELRAIREVLGVEVMSGVVVPDDCQAT